MKKASLALLLCASLLWGMLALTSCGASSANLQYRSNGDGTCTVLGFDKPGESAVIPATAPNGEVVTAIAADAFKGCDELAEITVPDTVVKIGKGAFTGSAYYNDEANWQDGVLYIGKHLIAAKMSLAGCYTVKEGTLTVADEAFRACEGLTGLALPESLVAVGTDIIRGCPAMETVTVSADNATYYAEGNCLVERSTQTLCLGTKNSTVPDDGSILHIGERAFAYCTGLDQLVLPAGVKTVGISAFDGCTSLTTASLPKSLESMGRFAFSGCDVLTRIDFDGTTEEWAAIQKDSFGQWKSGTHYFSVYCTDGTVPKNEA